MYSRNTFERRIKNKREREGRRGRKEMLAMYKERNAPDVQVFLAHRFSGELDSILYRILIIDR